MSIVTHVTVRIEEIELNFNTCHFKIPSALIFDAIGGFSGPFSYIGSILQSNVV